MAERAPQNTIDTGSGGTYIKDAFDQTLAEFVALYGHINSALKLQTGAAQPGTPMTGELWVDTSSGAAILRRYSGSTWEQLGESGGFASGVPLDTGMAGYSRGMWLARASAASLSIAGTSTVMLNGNLLQNTGTTTVSTGLSGASGDFAIYVQRSGTTSTYTLHAAAYDTFSPTVNQRTVGRAIKAGGDFTSITSTEPGAASDSSVPAGSILAYGGAAAPTGWLLCDGSVVSQTEYAALYAAIGDAYNDGSEGAGEFCVPNLVGRVPLGLDSGDSDFDTLGLTPGAKSSPLPAHAHTIAAESTAILVTTHPGGTAPLIAQNSSNTSTEGTGPNPIPTVPPALVVNFIIKA